MGLKHRDPATGHGQFPGNAGTDDACSNDTHMFQSGMPPQTMKKAARTMCRAASCTSFSPAWAGREYKLTV